MGRILMIGAGGVATVAAFKIAAARKMLNANRAGVDKSAEVLDNLIKVRDDLKELKRQLDGLV